MKKMCAVCGDTTALNVRLVWQRYSDHKQFNVCLYCAEQNRVNEYSVNRYKGGQVKKDEEI